MHAGGAARSTMSGAHRCEREAPTAALHADESSSSWGPRRGRPRGCGALCRSAERRLAPALALRSRERTPRSRAIGVAASERVIDKEGTSRANDPSDGHAPSGRWFAREKLGGHESTALRATVNGARAAPARAHSGAAPPTGFSHGTDAARTPWLERNLRHRSTQSGTPQRFFSGCSCFGDGRGGD
jgi:hypothetical protein